MPKVLEGDQPTLAGTCELIPMEEWAAVLAQWEDWTARVWGPACVGQLEDATWRVTAPITVAIGGDPWREIKLKPGMSVRAKSRTYIDDGDWGWYPFLFRTTRVLVLDGLHAGTMGEYETRDAYVSLLQYSLPPVGLEPVESEPVLNDPAPHEPARGLAKARKQRRRD